MTHQAILFDKLADYKVRCRLCSHYCLIENNDVGECLTRKNINGNLKTQTYGNINGMAVDPVEKKPFYHYKPGSRILSFGTPGCNFRCLNCQNWNLSQAFKNSESKSYDKFVSPKDIAQSAIVNNVDGIAYTYSEPTIFFEYARDVILECKKNKSTAHLSHMFVSNGYLSKETLDLIEQENLISAINIDLKFIDDDKYQEICGARLKPVLDTIKRVVSMKNTIHLEIINLLIPGKNDSTEDIKKLSEFICSLAADIPLHFSRFYPQFKMSDCAATRIETLVKAREIALNSGLKYVFIGNAEISGSSDTYCPGCNETLISRSRYGIKKNVFEQSGGMAKPVCPSCGENINIIL